MYNHHEIAKFVTQFQLHDHFLVDFFFFLWGGGEKGGWGCKLAEMITHKKPNTALLSM